MSRINEKSNVEVVEAENVGFGELFAIGVLVINLRDDQPSGVDSNVSIKLQQLNSV